MEWENRSGDEKTKKKNKTKSHPMQHIDQQKSKNYGGILICSLVWKFCYLLDTGKQHSLCLVKPCHLVASCNHFDCYSLLFTFFQKQNEKEKKKGKNLENNWSKRWHFCEEFFFSFVFVFFFQFSITLYLFFVLLTESNICCWHGLYESALRRLVSKWNEMKCFSSINGQNNNLELKFFSKISKNVLLNHKNAIIKSQCTTRTPTMCRSGRDAERDVDFPHRIQIQSSNLLSLNNLYSTF